MNGLKTRVRELTMVLASYDESSVESDARPLDRRRGLRIAQNRPVKVYEPGASRFFAGRSRNVSSTGLQLEFRSFVQLPVGRLINLHVGLDDHGHTLANRRNMVLARVVWTSTETVMNTELLVVGVELLSSTSARIHAA